MAANLDGNDEKVFAAAVVAAVAAAGPAGERELLEALEHAGADEDRVIVLVGALGEVEGDLGAPMLRRLTAQADVDEDVRCAAKCWLRCVTSAGIWHRRNRKRR